MSVSCAPAVASEIRPTPGGCICPVRLLVAADARRWRRGRHSTRRQRPPRAASGGPFVAWGIFSHSRGEAGHLRRAAVIFLTRGVGCPFGAAPARPRYARCTPAHAIRRAKLAGWRCAPSGGHRRLSWPRLRVRGRSAPAKRRRTVRPCPGRAPAAHYARGRRPAKFSRRVCTKPSGRSPRPIPPPPQGGGDMPRPPVPKSGTASRSAAKRGTRRKHPPVRSCRSRSR